MHNLTTTEENILLYLADNSEPGDELDQTTKDEVTRLKSHEVDALLHLYQRGYIALSSSDYTITREGKLQAEEIRTA